MSFVVRMAARELRASWRRLLLFFVCIALGVGGIVLLRSVVQEVRAAITRDARSMVAADVTLSTNRAWTDETRHAIDRVITELGVEARTDSIETATMVRPVTGRAVTRMVEVRGVQPGFPLYGRVEVEGGRPYAHALLAGRGALVRPELLVQLDLKVGDEILIGREPFTIRGVVLAEPGRRAGAFSFGSRVLVDAAALEQSGLLGEGSRVTRQVLLKVPDRLLERLVREMRQAVRGRFVTVRSWRSTEERVGEDFDRAENYLSLVGLVIAILGGIGVSSVTRVFVQQKVRSIAVLKCLGATSRQVFAAYLLQAVVLGLAGAALGVLLAAAGMRAIPAAFGGSVAGVLLPTSVTASAVGQGVAIGLLVAVLFSVVPLLDVRRVKPALLLRESLRAARERDWVRWAALLGVAGALVLVASWQAASWAVGLTVSAGLAVVTVVLHLVGLALVRVIRPLAASRSVPLRHAVLRLTRPGNQTRAVLLAVGLGAFFIVGVRSLQESLLREFALNLDVNAADMFLIDIQPEQVEGVTAFLRERASPNTPPPIPVLRARVVGVQGRNVTLNSYDEVRRRGLGREYVVTWRSHLQANERITRGQFWQGGQNPEGEVSIARNVREEADIDVGDTMQFDVLGRVVSAKVTSVREVDWRDARQGGFIFVFRPGVLDGAPASYIAPARGPAEVTARARLQRDLVDRFPNVSVIDLREILDVVQTVLGRIALGVSVVGGLVLVTGVLILVGSVSMTRFQRIYEAAVFRTLGAGTRLLTAMTALEYGVLGLLAGGVGSAAGLALTWSLTRLVFNIPWRPDLGLAGTGLALTATLVAAVGLLASADILRRRPLGALRGE